MTKKLAILVALTFVFSAKVFAEVKAPAKAAPAKQPKVVETRINEGDMSRLEVAVNKAVKEAYLAKQGPGGFEYMAKKMKPPKNDKWQDKWNELGSKGWEAVDHFENVYIFKRPSMASAPSYVKPAASPAAAVPAVAPIKEDKAAKKAVKEDEKVVKKAEKEKEKAAKKAEKAAKKAEKEKEKAAKKASKEKAAEKSKKETKKEVKKETKKKKGE